MTDWHAASRACERAVDLAARLDADAHTRLVLAYKTHLVRLRPETLPPPARARFLRLHDELCVWPPGDPARDYTAHIKALYPEQAADLLAQLVELKNAVRLLLEEHDA